MKGLVRDWFEHERRKGAQKPTIAEQRQETKSGEPKKGWKDGYKTQQRRGKRGSGIDRERERERENTEVEKEERRNKAGYDSRSGKIGRTILDTYSHRSACGK